MRVTENKQNRLESEIEVTQKRAKELHRQNRSLQDEQRELELDIKVSKIPIKTISYIFQEMQRELEATEELLEQKETSARAIAR